MIYSDLTACLILVLKKKAILGDDVESVARKTDVLKKGDW